MTSSVLVPPEAKLTLQIYGNSLPQLFENAGRELLNLFINPQDVGDVLREKVVIEAADTEALFQAWVEALLELACTQHILFKTYRFQEFEAERAGAGRLRAQVGGELIDPLRHLFRKEPMRWHCDHIHLLNNSKTIEAQVILTTSTKIQK